MMIGPIWPNRIVDDHHFGYITKSEKKENTGWMDVKTENPISLGNIGLKTSFRI
jgi:hypothetical protein